MMDQDSLCCAAILLLFFASPSGSSSLIANANISTSWINTPSSPYDTPYSSHNFKPILSTGDHFYCGFYCNNDKTQTACLLAVFIHNPRSSGSPFTFFRPQLVWSANRNRPVKQNATLQLTRDGDLVLTDADGTFVWSTNTSGKSVSSLNLTGDGNLVLFDGSNGTVWQSFDHPTDSLLVGQTLVPGQKLTANISPSNWSQGLYSLLFTRRYLRAYIETNTPTTTYFQTSTMGERHLKYENGSFNNFVLPLVLGPQFMRLESDGHLKIYRFREYSCDVVADLLTEDVSDCVYPMMCGNYGICSKGECVGCPDEANSKVRNFKQINFRQPSLGCSPITPISCDQSQYHTFLELQNTSYFGFDPIKYLYYTNKTWDVKTEVEDCKKSCLSNCSCKAVSSYAVDHKSKTEILCGRKNLDKSQREEEMHLLCLFERKGEEGRLSDMVDKYNSDMQLHGAEVVEMMKVAIWCLQSDYQRRPSMTVVVQVLEGLVTVPDNLEYSFINAPARRTMAATAEDMDAIDDDTPLLASILSGPR
ncbi:hypothetical protein Vadar_034490 [Vaccinium darrowii]|uniref:Uncharacterized protein n=1 Tax=Vaccinium darrowii TaxID=229202 RepID=A0ACB7Z8H7_9ERIC|nr:hypothetical protein Vadar_034490 [Vaccinium darrowii]